MAATVGLRPAQPTMPVTHASASPCAATAAASGRRGGEPVVLLPSAAQQQQQAFGSTLSVHSTNRTFPPCTALPPGRTRADALLANQDLGLARRALEQLPQLRRLVAVTHADQGGLELAHLRGAGAGQGSEGA